MEAHRAERVLKVIQDEIGEVSADSSFEELEVDSLEFLSLCQTLEREFSVKLSDEQLANVRTVEDLVLLVQYSPRETPDHVSN